MSEKSINILMTFLDDFTTDKILFNVNLTIMVKTR